MEQPVQSENLYVGIIAGGLGTRLFPLSHDECPKQFCLLDAENTFIQATVKRFISVGVQHSNIVVIVTNEKQRALAKKQLCKMGILSQNIHMISPNFGYAGAMVAAAEFIYEINPQAVIINTPSDQYIREDEDFAETMLAAISNAALGSPTLVGVKVNDLNTVMGCGHAIYDQENDEVCKLVTGFVEKPKREEADKLMRRNISACNTGINVWTAKLIMEIMEREQIQLEDGIATDRLMSLFDELKVAVGNFDWYDCGTLKSLYEISQKTPNHKNARLGKGVTFRHNCIGSLFISIEDVEIHASGIENSAVVVNEIGGKIVLAVVRLDDSQEVRELAEDYQQHKKFLLQDFSMGARNNRISNTAMSEQIRVGFVGVSNHTVTAIKYADSGKIVIAVTNDSRFLEQAS